MVLPSPITHPQSIYAALYGGVGSGLGAIVGGVIVQKYGIQRMFVIHAAILLGGWLLCWVLDTLAALGARPAAAKAAVERASDASRGSTDPILSNDLKHSSATG